MREPPEEPISWELAERVATRIAARQPWLPLGRVTVLEEEFAELTAEAEGLVAEETGLRSLVGPARARVTDRPGWVSANVASFQRLLRPLTQKLEAVMAKPAPMLGPVPMRVPAQLSRNISGVQLGLLLGWMSTRVLGQYDQLLIEDEEPEQQDIVYYVGHNVIELEDRYGFQPRQFRLWIALHEVTHRAQFTGVPWLRRYFLSQVSTLLEGVDPDPRHLVEALKRAAAEAREGHNPLDEGGLVALLASPEQRVALDRIGGFMSLLEGHGDVVMNRAAQGRVAQAPRFARVLQQRRQRGGAAKVVSSLVGLDAKLKQYELGERFVEAVEKAGGRELFERVWQGPEWLPRWARSASRRAGSSEQRASARQPDQPASPDRQSDHTGSSRVSTRLEWPTNLGDLLGRCSFPIEGTPVTCAVSGGADSMAMLALAVAAACRPHAVYIDHGLRPGGKEEAAVVRAGADALGASFEAVSIAVGPGPDLEARARHARYAALPEGCMVGHTADDQAETLVLNLLRGAGLDGLSGMQAAGGGPRRAQRPILALRRTETRSLATALGLELIDDPSNLEARFRRNRVRHEVMPLLAEVAGRDSVPVLARTAALLAEDARFLDLLASELDPTDARALVKAPFPLAKRALRTWFREDEGPEHHPPSAREIERAWEVVTGHAVACELSGGRRLSRSAGRLRIDTK